MLSPRVKSSYSGVSASWVHNRLFQSLRQIFPQQELNTTAIGYLTTEESVGWILSTAEGCSSSRAALAELPCMLVAAARHEHRAHPS